MFRYQMQTSIRSLAMTLLFKQWLVAFKGSFVRQSVHGSLAPITTTPMLIEEIVLSHVTPLLYFIILH